TAEPRFKVGIFPATRRTNVGLLESFDLGAGQVWFISKLTVRGLVGMFSGSVSTKNIAGPIFIFKQGMEAAKSGIDRLMDLMVFLSVSLAILNLLPIPILDGGHLVFFTLEALTGSPLNEKLQERAMQVGMAFLLLLMVFAISNDVRRLIADWL
ncbi:MAG: site-2 protease family protein, partial [Bdellovibrionales bacterium]|nr:site-2 protease family protein [Bdellovibrionales bacterium]